LVLVVPLFLLSGLPASSGKGSGKAGEVVEVLRGFLVRSLPENSTWQFKSGTRAQLEGLKKYLHNAVKLKYFGPWRLISLVRWSEKAGYPGYVTEDHRVLFNPETQEFVLSSLQWVNTHRKAHPVKISGLGPDEIGSYLAEVVSVIPRLDNFGFRIEKVEVEAPLTVKITYDPRANRGAASYRGPRQDVIEMGPDGSIRKSRLLMPGTTGLGPR
jgi:hypothetical protein